MLDHFRLRERHTQISASSKSFSVSKQLRPDNKKQNIFWGYQGCHPQKRRTFISNIGPNQIKFNLCFHLLRHVGYPTFNVPRSANPTACAGVAEAVRCPGRNDKSSCRKMDVCFCKNLAPLLNLRPADGVLNL